MGAPQLTVLDASALVAALLHEPGEALADELLRQQPPPSISAVNLAEVIDRLVRVEGYDAGDVNDRIDLLMVGGLEVEPVWLKVTRLAASLRAKHYHRSNSPLSMADCVCLATAMTLQTDLATTDPALAKAARASDVEVIPLPDSSSRLP